MINLRKVVAVGITAGLLTSLVATSAFAAAPGGKSAQTVVVTSAGSVVPGGTSATAATVQFVEESAAAWPSTSALDVMPAYQYIRLVDASLSDTTLHFTSASLVTAPGTLGASMAVTSGFGGANNIIVVKITNSNPSLIEAITISFKIKADAGAALGGAQLVSMPGNFPIAATASDTKFWVGNVNETYTLTGKVSAASSTSPFTVVVDPSFQTLGCFFLLPEETTGRGSIKVGGTSTVVFGDPTPAVPGTTTYLATAVSAGPGPQTVAWSGNSGVLPRTLLANDPVTQVIPIADCPTSLFLVGSPVTVVGGVTVTTGSTLVRPGYNNQVAGEIAVRETNIGAVAAGSTITFTITTPGVLFSGLPYSPYGSYVAGGGWIVGAPTLNPGRTALSFPVTTASTVTVGTLNVIPHYDVASTVAAGTGVEVGVAISGGTIVSPATVTNAYVNNIIAPTAAQPTIYIGFNGQNTGMITYKESAAGWFTDGTGTNNLFEVCIETGEQFTTAPWAVVTAGDLKLFASVSTPATSLQGLADGPDCYYWYVYTASTVASTIEIRGTDPATGNTPLASGENNGPQVNVPTSLRPGTTQMSLWTSNDLWLGMVANAVRAYKNALTIAAASVPYISAGATMAPAGNLTLTETQNGQLDAGTWICVEVVPRTSTSAETATRDVYLGASSTNDLPVISTNGNTSGLLTTKVFYFGQDACQDATHSSSAAITLGQTATAFAFEVTQGSINALGSITISGIKYTALTNAVNGPVQLNVYTLPCWNQNQTMPGSTAQFEGCPTPAVQESQGAVTNARIGIQPVGRLDISPVANANPTSSTFNQATAIVKVGQRVTLRGTFSGTYAGDLVEIWVKEGSSGAWAKQTSRRIMPGGTFTYSPKVLVAGYQYYKVMFVGSVANSSAISNVVRAYGK